MTMRWEDDVDEAALTTGLTLHYWRGPFAKNAPDIADVLVGRLRPCPPDPSYPHRRGSRRHLVAIWEPLRTKAPSPSRCAPFCCYVRSVIFYHRPYIPSGPHPYHRRGRDWCWTEGGFAQFDQIETRLGGGDIVVFEGERFEIGGGHVVWHRRRWWMRFWARRVERARWETAA